MTERFQIADRQFFYTRILSSDLKIEIHGFYPVLIWSSVPGVAVEEIAAVIQKLLASGCRYVVVGGAECERWHDIADEQCLMQFPNDAEQGENFVMTTWHEGESPEDVTFFFVNNTNFEDHDFKQFLVLQFGEDSVVESQLKEGVRKWAGPPAG